MFGNRWAPAAAPLAWASAGLVVSGPISVATSGFLYSEGDVRTPLRASTIERDRVCGPDCGAARPDRHRGVGVAWMFASLTEAVIFGRALRRYANLAVERLVCVPVAAAFVSAVLAYALRPPFSSQPRRRHRDCDSRADRIPLAQPRVQPHGSRQPGSTAAIIRVSAIGGRGRARAPGRASRSSPAGQRPDPEPRVPKVAEAIGAAGSIRIDSPSSVDSFATLTAAVDRGEVEVVPRPVQGAARSSSNRMPSDLDFDRVPPVSIESRLLTWRTAPLRTALSV